MLPPTHSFLKRFTYFLFRARTLSLSLSLALLNALSVTYTHTHAHTHTHTHTHTRPLFLAPTQYYKWTLVPLGILAAGVLYANSHGLEAVLPFVTM